jgi:tRNA 2-selenouridine synthase
LPSRIIIFEAANIYLFPFHPTPTPLPSTFSPDFFLQKALNCPVLDVRSPAEYESGHIPGSLNLPLFTNEERAIVGTLYKQQGPNPAMIHGLEIVGPKMADFVRVAQKMAPHGELLVYCWRGGKRSGSMAWLFENAGMTVNTLRGGYKAYRNHVLNGFNKPFKFKVVGGETGSGKTDILHTIGQRGHQIIDLEAIAKHRGSAFGSLGLPQQPSVEQFENNLFTALEQLNIDRPIWIEDESKSIGRVYIPKDFWQLKVNAPVYLISIPFELRVQRLLKDYGHFSKEELAESINKIAKRLGGLDTQLALAAIENGDLAETARIALKYYDKCYGFPHENRKFEGVHLINSKTGDAKMNAELILSHDFNLK